MVLSDEEQKLQELISRHQDALKKALKREYDTLEVFEKYIDAIEEYSVLMECKTFEMGFKLASKIYIEASV